MDTGPGEEGLVRSWERAETARPAREGCQMEPPTQFHSLAPTAPHRVTGGNTLKFVSRNK